MKFGSPFFTPLSIAGWMEDMVSVNVSDKPNVGKLGEWGEFAEEIVSVAEVLCESKRGPASPKYAAPPANLLGPVLLTQ